MRLLFGPHSWTCCTGPLSMSPVPPVLRSISSLSTTLLATHCQTPVCSLFVAKLKILLFNKYFPDLSSSLYLPLHLNSKHHSRLTVYLPDSLDPTCYL